ncbi:MAG: RnfH family protein [Betaproteobacteria bacterium]|nr:RnfH family protein [Betaproteobacteria bacterium]
MQVTVAYALPDRQTLLTLEVEPGCTLETALRCSGLLERHPEIDLGRQAVGISGRVRAMTTVLKAGDRVEVYRPRLADPKALRRSRAQSP